MIFGKNNFIIYIYKKWEIIAVRLNFVDTTGQNKRPEKYFF